MITLKSNTNAVAQRPVAMITGGAGGIGLEVAKRLMSRGYHLVIVEKDADIADAACKELGLAATAYPCDLSDSEQVRKLCVDISARWKDTLEVLICNAGVILPSDVANTTESAVDLQLDVMLRSPLQLMRAALPDMVRRDCGHLLATVSIGGIYPMPGSATYSAAKAGLRAFLAATATELRDTNVHVGGVYPSAVDTPMLLKEARAGGSPLNFVGSVQTIDAVANGFERAIDRKKLEVYIPYMDGIQTRLVTAFPALLTLIYPLLKWLGEKGERRFLAAAEKSATRNQDIPATSRESAS